MVDAINVIGDPALVASTISAYRRAVSGHAVCT